MCYMRACVRRGSTDHVRQKMPSTKDTVLDNHRFANQPKCVADSRASRNNSFSDFIHTGSSGRTCKREASLSLFSSSHVFFLCASQNGPAVPVTVTSIDISASTVVVSLRGAIFAHPRTVINNAAVQPLLSCGILFGWDSAVITNLSIPTSLLVWNPFCIVSYLEAPFNVSDSHLNNYYVRYRTPTIIDSSLLSVTGQTDEKFQRPFFHSSQSSFVTIHK